jgi:UDP-N-acetylmuramate--alanine ligase
VINGGIIEAYGTTRAWAAATGWWSRPTNPTAPSSAAGIAIVTNVDPEHLDHFKTFEAVQEAFRSFVENPFYGFAVMCTDHAVCISWLAGWRIAASSPMENPQADVRLVDLDHANGASQFSVVFRDRAGDDVHEIKAPRDAQRRHNALNATAAIAVAHELASAMRRSAWRSRAFGGVRRRSPRPVNGTASRSSTTTPPPGRDRSRAARGTRIDQRAGDRGDAAASLYASAFPVRAVLDLFQ